MVSLCSIGMRASVPSANIYGDSPVVVRDVVQYAQKTECSSFIRFPLASSSLFFNLLSKVLFITSVCPLLWGCLRSRMQFLNIGSSTVICELIIVKLYSMVGNESRGQPIPTNDVFPYELIDLLIRHIYQKLCLHQFCKIIHDDHQVFKSSSGGWQWPDQVYAPHSKWPWWSDWSENSLVEFCEL